MLVAPALEAIVQRHRIGTGRHHRRFAGSEQPIERQRRRVELADPQQIVRSQQRTDSVDSGTIGKDRFKRRGVCDRRDEIRNAQIGELDNLERAVAASHQRQHHRQRSVGAARHDHQRRCMIGRQQRVVEPGEPQRMLECRRGGRRKQLRILARREVEGGL